MGVETAILGAGIIGAGASMAGSSKQAKAIRQAAELTPQQKQAQQELAKYFFGTPETTERYWVPNEYLPGTLQRLRLPFLGHWETRTIPGIEGALYREPEAYTGEFVAPLTPAEQMSQDMLTQYLTQPLPEIYGIAGQELERTLTGGYDPFTSPYYQAMREVQQRELGEAKKRLAEDLSARGLYYSGIRGEGLGDLEKEYLQNMGVLAGQLAEAERQRRIQAVPLAMQLGGVEAAYPLTQISAAQQYGQLPRMLQQAQLEAEYREWLRQQGVQDKVIDQILSFLGSMPTGNRLQGEVAAQNVLSSGYSGATNQLINALLSAGMVGSQQALLLPALGQAQTNALASYPYGLAGF